MTCVKQLCHEICETMMRRTYFPSTIDLQAKLADADLCGGPRSRVVRDLDQTVEAHQVVATLGEEVQAIHLSKATAQTSTLSSPRLS